ncbi:MAG: serine/threonine-protein kinase, partial [Planctomycetota bacterium]
MRKEDWALVEQAFLEACDADDERQRAVRKSFASQHPALVPVLDDLLRGHTAGTSFFTSLGEKCVTRGEGELASWITSHLGGYALGEFLGSGSMGVVLKGRKPGLERDVAIKVLAPSLGGHDKLADRFRVEIAACSRLAHPGIVTVLDAGEDRGLLWFAMELVLGGDLQGRIRSWGEKPASRPSAETLAVMGASVARGLHHAHIHGVLHRDVKPSNILVDEASSSGRLIDFGLARLIDGEGLTLSGETMGTPRYMSPEQVRASRSGVDHRTDVYSLGVVLFEAISGEAPFQGRSPHEILMAIAAEEARPLRELVPDVPVGLAAIVNRALVRDPSKRFQTALEFAEDLERFARNERTVTRPPVVALPRWLAR